MWIAGRGHRSVSLKGKVELEGKDTCPELVPRPQRDPNLPGAAVFVAQAHGHNPSQAEDAVTVGGQSGRFCGQGGYPKWLPDQKKKPRKSLTYKASEGSGGALGKRHQI